MTPLWIFLVLAPVGAFILIWAFVTAMKPPVLRVVEEDDDILEEASEADMKATKARRAAAKKAAEDAEAEAAAEKERAEAKIRESKFMSVEGLKKIAANREALAAFPAEPVN